MPRIQLTTPDGSTFEAELSADRVTVGRNEGNDIVVPDSSVSGSHGEFSNEGGAWVFTDLGSTNGTKVNGERVDRLEVTHGAQFEFGDVAVIFIEDAAAYETPAPVATSPSGRQSSAASAPADGYGNRPLDRSSRIGFGPKKPVKDGSRSLLMFFGFVSLLAALGFIGMLMSSGL
ncbi:MAG: FHA domain-containing protein [Verrucomicrobiaceae bacterium]|nr:FHA domain-containing protein [Verrucomicrobiaceae bacterium]